MAALSGSIASTVPPGSLLTEEQRESLRRRYLLRRFWRSAAGFWGGRWSAALDPKSQDRLMELLLERSDTTVVSVAHRPELEAFHTRKIVLARRAEGAKLVRDIDLPAQPLHRSLWRWLQRKASGAPAARSST